MHCYSAMCFCLIFIGILSFISLFLMTKSSGTESFKTTGSKSDSFWARHCYLVAFPVSEEVDGSIFPPLDKRPATSVHVMLTPSLYRCLRPVRLEKIRPTGGMSCLHRLKTVPKGTSRHTHTNEWTPTADEERASIKLFNTDIYLHLCSSDFQI